MTADSAVIHVEAITTSDSLQRVRPEWSCLWAEDPSATPFQSPEWLIPWWRHIAQGELWTLACRGARDSDSPGRLVGLVPLYIYTSPQSAMREVFPLGIATTDYLDGVFAPGWARQAMAAALDYLNAHRRRWDVVDLPQLRPGSPMLTGTAASGHDHVTPGEPCPVLTLPATVEDLPRHVPSQLLSNLRYYRRRAERKGQLSIEEADATNLQSLYATLLQLHGARWRERSEGGVLASQCVQAWHAEMLPGLLSLGVLRLYALRLDGRVIAVLYGLMDRPKAGRRFYYYLSGFDPAYQHLSPGTLVIGHAVECAIREGAEFFDFLRGQEPYKYHWGAKDTPVCRRRITPIHSLSPVTMTRMK